MFELHYGRVVGLALVKLDFKELVDEGLLLEIVAVFLFEFTGSRCCLFEHLIEKSWRHFLDPVHLIIVAIV